MHKTIAIIPARGGSKRLPEKNIMDFFGKSMLERAIDAARKSECFDKIFVSTDSQKIAEEARRCGVTVPFLREEATDDFATVSQATVHTLQQILARQGETFDIVCQLMPNCPLRTDRDIRDSLDTFEKEKRTFQISCFRFGWMNPYWAVRLSGDARPEYMFPESKGKRSQDLPPLYCPTGAIWIAGYENLLREKTFYGTDVRFHEIPWQSAVDIDNHDDLEMAKAVYNLIHAQ